MTDQPQTPSQKQSLFTLRIIWFALLAGQMAFMFVVLFLIAGEPINDPEQPADLAIFYISSVMLATLLPAGLFIRNQIYKQHWQDDCVTERGYFTGNLILLVLMEGVSFLGLVAVMINGSLLPYILPSFIAMLIQVINFPSGRPMEPTQMQ